MGEKEEMIKLEYKDYDKALPLLRNVKANTLFAETVLEQQMAGAVYADSAENPRSFHVVHPYGMSLLFGDPGNKDFNGSLRDYITNRSGARHRVEWLQADPEGEWIEWMDSIMDTHNSLLENDEGLSSEQLENQAILRNTRVNFRFDPDAYLEAKQSFPMNPEPVVRMTKDMFAGQTGSVIPRFFWRDEDHFDKVGAGFAILQDGVPASVSFSAFRTPHQLEIGIETATPYRKKGFAIHVCSALIDYCLENGLEPVWACRLDNEGSYLLARKLGFRPAVTLPYYRLPV